MTAEEAHILTSEKTMRTKVITVFIIPTRAVFKITGFNNETLHICQIADFCITFIGNILIKSTSTEFAAFESYC